MQRRILALALAAVLALALTGCGGRYGTSDGAASDTDSRYSGGVTDRSGTDGASAGHGGTGSTTSTAGRSNRQSDSLLGNSYTNPTRRNYDITWDEMVENGRVHDSDGYLLDGENHVTR